MRKRLLSLLMPAFMSAVCTAGGPRIVSEPPVEAASNAALDITKIAVTDSATVVDFHARFLPGKWIRIDKESHLLANGKEYHLTSARGITPDSLLWMPENGEVDFSLSFKPVPYSVNKIDYLEGYDPQRFALYGIDISGKDNTADAYPEGLPEEFRNQDFSGFKNEPLLKIAPTEIRIHQLGYKPEFRNKTIVLNSLGYRDEMSVPLDSMGNGTLRADLFGTTELNIFTGALIVENPAKVTVDPGESIDVWLSPVAFTDAFESRVRNNNRVPAHPYAYTNGKYAALASHIGDISRLDLGECVSDKIDWQMNADQYTDMVIAARDSLLRETENAALPEGVKKYIANSICMQALGYMCNARSHLYNDFRRKMGSVKFSTDSLKANLQPENFSRTLSAIDGNDMSYLTSPYLATRSLISDDLTKMGAKGFLFDELFKFGIAFDHAGVGRAEDRMLATLDTFSDPYFAEAVRIRQADAKKAIAKAKEVAGTDPSMSGMDLFNSLMAPYKGKVVLVDLWNTWCGPCRNAFVHNEPLKTGELASDDIVWVYIADDTSDMKKYAEMIPGIKGHHHIINSKQRKEIYEAFGVDGIPFYILVDRDGNAVPHPEFRDPKKLIHGIKAKL